MTEEKIPSTPKQQPEIRAVVIEVESGIATVYSASSDVIVKIVDLDAREVSEYHGIYLHDRQPLE